MAEPLPPLPATAPKNEPVPWPKVAAPEPPEIQQSSPEIVESNIKSAATEVREKLHSAFESFSDEIQLAYDKLQRSISRGVSTVGRKVRYLRRERPMQIVAGVAIASFLAGVALRIWRSNHD